jgi:hypothetical protein
LYCRSKHDKGVKYDYSNKNILLVYLEKFRSPFCPSVADQDLPDPHVFGHPESRSTGQRYESGTGSESGSRSFYHNAEIVRKTMIPPFL